MTPLLWLQFAAILFSMLVANVIAVYAVWRVQQLQEQIDWITQHGVFTKEPPRGS